MSNKLKRKTTPKRSQQQIKHHIDWKLAEGCYSEIFTSMQLICFTVLYMSKEDGGFDFSKKKLQNFNNFLTLHNQENVDGVLSSKETEKSLRKTGFDCELEASQFPYRAKMKMLGKKCKPSNIRVMLASANVAIEAYLILAVYTLRKHYGFSHQMIREWWTKCIEVSELYAKGMTDDFVMKFIKDELGLEITRE